MDLLKLTKKISKQYNITPKRSKGQNFLITEPVYDRIIEAADLKSNEVVLEVGPGFGFLTERLAKKAKQVIAVELDDKLAKVLHNRLKNQNIKNVKIINDNILDFFTNYKLQITNYKIVANLPYNISSIFLRKFLSNGVNPDMLVLMLQKEVAERIVSQPPKMSLLAVSVQFYAKAEIIEYVGKDNFWPQPKVDSAIVKINIKNVETIHGSSQINEKLFFRLIKHGFAGKRKMLKNNLSAGLEIDQKIMINKLKSIGISEKARAQELSLEKWLKLFDSLKGFML